MGDPDDVDNHAAMIGPSYRGTGPSYRGTGPSYRGTGPANRGTRVAQASPGAGAPPRQSFIGRIVNDQLAKTQARAIAAAQLEADQLMEELRPFYAARYAKYGGKAKHKPGDRVPIAVLGRQDFEASRTVLDAELLAEEHALITKYIPHAASKVISGHGRMASVTLIPVTAATILTPLQLELIKPRKGKSTRGLAGFYSVARDTIFVRVDQVEAGTIAHELGHAYASSLWGEFYVAMVLQTEQVRRLVRSPDEARDALTPCRTTKRPCRLHDHNTHHSGEFHPLDRRGPLRNPQGEYVPNLFRWRPVVHDRRSRAARVRRTLRWSQVKEAA